MKTEKKILLAFVLFVLAVIVVKVNKKEEETVLKHKEGIRFSQNANGSSGEFWKYQLDAEDVIKEIEYYESRHFLNFGPGYEQNWIFEVVNPGEVTITWLKYESGRDFEGSYSIRYHVDINGELTVLTDSRKTEEKQVHFSNYASGSLGECWKYELSSNGILEETEHYRSGLGNNYHWVFTPIGEGKVTIDWKLYDSGGLNYNEKESYSITYYFDEFGNHTVLEDTRE